MTKRIKTIESTVFQGVRYLRVWQYTARGGKALAMQIRLKEGEKPAEVLHRPDVREILVKEFGVKGL